jgi:hypothetical protein
MAYRFTVVPMLRQSNRRSIGFLECDEDSDLDAKDEFEALNLNKERDVRKKFDSWIDGIRNDNWYHGWPNDEQVKECWSFRWDDRGNKHNRFYGFLYNPLPKTNASFQVCVLTYHDVKNTWDTDRKLLTDSMLLRGAVAVRNAISMVFDDTVDKGRVQ